MNIILKFISTLANEENRVVHEEEISFPFSLEGKEISHNGQTIAEYHPDLGWALPGQTTYCRLELRDADEDFLDQIEEDAQEAARCGVCRNKYHQCVCS